MKSLLSISLFSALVITSSHAATTFVTNTSGNAAALNGATDSDVTALPLSPEDGGGTINLTTIDVSGTASLFMDGDSMGHANDKWGNLQNWTFSFDQTISFDALTFKTINENMTLLSPEWVGNANATGSNWSFDGASGEITILGSNGPGTYDFTTDGDFTVTAGTAITFGFLGGASGGEELTSFTITAIPEPSAFLLGGLGSLLLLRRRC